MVNSKLGEKVNPPLIIYNLNQQEIHELQETDHWNKIAQIYMETGQKLVSAGAEAILFCANTPHKIYGQVDDHFDIPILHIADGTGREANEKGLKKLGLIGTKYTMNEPFIKERLSGKYGLEISVPDQTTQQELHRIIHEELSEGDFNDKAREYVLAKMDELRSRGAEGMILGCTEFPILVKQADYDLPLFDTSYLHSKVAVDFILS